MGNSKSSFIDQNPAAPWPGCRRGRREARRSAAIAQDPGRDKQQGRAESQSGRSGGPTRTTRSSNPVWVSGKRLGEVPIGESVESPRYAPRSSLQGGGGFIRGIPISGPGYHIQKGGGTPDPPSDSWGPGSPPAFASVTPWVQHRNHPGASQPF